MIRIRNQNYTKEVTKQVLRSAIITTKNNLTYYYKSTISAEDTQDISGILEFKEEATEPTDTWKIKGIYKCYNSTSKRCNLCLAAICKYLNRNIKICKCVHSELATTRT